MDIYNTNKPDYEIEQFWFSYKKSMYNFYYGFENIESYNKKENLKLYRPIDLWCDYLNGLQLIKKYEEIEENIHNYMSLYAIDLMRNNDNYHCGILQTNIKRWNHISNKYKISSNDGKYYNLVFALLDIYISLKNANIDVFDVFTQIELFLIYKDYSSLIKLSISHNKPNIIDKLLKYNNNIYKQIEKIYELEPNSCKNTSAFKIIKKISNNT